MRASRSIAPDQRVPFAAQTAELAHLGSSPPMPHASPITASISQTDARRVRGLAPATIESVHDSQFPIARLPSDSISRGFLHWRLSDDGPRVRGSHRDGPSSETLHNFDSSSEWGLGPVYPWLRKQFGHVGGACSGPSRPSGCLKEVIRLRRDDKGAVRYALTEASRALSP